ncbi:hypothetical protein [Pseudoalteromonas marina]|uniref:Uncharacterized protein n=1 Tax=Pseudoalteromonas marina TaxID=267375 RepID=A0ABT9FH81_9GAMM|nr:hypothetical protein [Pseudoalteromonas marina]MDP2565851.1 hypothetical protein [Pseudoalteromonas marina]
MFVTGISVDCRGTKLVEDGFFAQKVGQTYELIYAVVDLASFIGVARESLTTQSILKILSSNGFQKSDFAFSESFSNAFLFRVVVSADGVVESFTPFLGSFALKRSFSFDSSIKDESFLTATKCLELVNKNRGSYAATGLTESLSPSLFVQSLNHFISGLLAKYLIKDHRVSAIVTGMQVHSFVVPSKFNVSEDQGSLVKIGGQYGALVEGAFASPVRIRYVRANYFLTGQINVQNLAVPIGSPLRNVDALINQVILFHHLVNVLKFDFAKGGDLKILGPTIHERVKYMEATTKHASLNTIDSGGLFLTEMSGKFLRDFVSFLISNKMFCTQLNSEILFKFCSFKDRVRLFSYFVSVGIYPQFVIDWLSIRQRKEGRSLIHLLSAIDLLFEGSEFNLLYDGSLVKIETSCVSDKVFINSILDVLGDDYVR